MNHVFTIPPSVSYVLRIGIPICETGVGLGPNFHTQNRTTMGIPIYKQVGINVTVPIEGWPAGQQAGSISVDHKN